MRRKWNDLTKNKKKKKPPAQEVWHWFKWFAKWLSLKKYIFITKEKAAHLWSLNEKV